MNNQGAVLGIGAAALVLGAVRCASADSVQLHRDDVIPVVMQSELSLSQSHEGDVFKAEVNDSHMLPWGSHLEGVVRHIAQKHGNTPAFMDIEFTTIILPDGHRTSFYGTPIPLSKNYVTQDRDGRWLAKKGVSKDTVVIGATAGGLVLGSMVRKPFEGAFLGALIGILASETDKEDVSDGDVVVPKGSKVGARVDESVTISFDGRWDNKGSNDDRLGPYDKDGYNKAGYDRYGYDRNGRYNAQYDGTRDGAPAVQGVPDNSGYDQYGFDKNGHYNPKYDSTRDNPPANRPAPAGRLRIEIDRKQLHYTGNEAPFKDGWVIMVPLRSTAEQLGFKVSKDNADGSFRIENDTDVFVAETDSKKYSLNHSDGALPARVEVDNGVAYIPIDAFTMLAKGSVYVNGTKYRPQP